MDEAASNAEALGNARKRGFSSGWDFWEAQLTSRRDAEAVVAATVSGQGNSSQTASLTCRWFDSPARV